VNALETFMPRLVRNLGARCVPSKFPYPCYLRDALIVCAHRTFTVAGKLIRIGNRIGHFEPDAIVRSCRSASTTLRHPG
jgi:hypothetical protein